MKKIKFIGFSVTGYGNPSYPVRFKELVAERGFEADISYAACGGLSIDSLPYLLHTIDTSGCDLVVLEIATSWWSLRHSSVNEVECRLRLCLQILRHKKVPVAFLNLYRRDLDDQDCVVQVLSNMAMQGIPVLDLKKHYRDLLKATGIDGTTDGTHPDQKTIDHIAASLYEFIFGDSQTEKKFRYGQSAAGSLNETDGHSLLSIQPGYTTELQSHEFNNRHGVLMRGWVLPQGWECEIVFDCPYVFNGVFFVYGPDTNYMTLMFEKGKTEIPMHDNMSFYRRIGFRTLPGFVTDRIKIFHPAETKQVDLQRESWEKVEMLNNYVLGFAVESIKDAV